MKTNVLITGAAGFIGKHLVRKLLGFGFNIICLDLSFNKEFKSEFEGKLELQTGNLKDTILIKNLVQEYSPDYVFHLAASKSRTNLLPEFKSSHEINYLGTLNLFESLLDCKNLKLVTILGTIEEYGNSKSPFKEDSLELPNSAYGLSKLSASKLAMIFNQQFNIPIVVLRPSIAYGPEQGEEMFIPALINALIKNQEFKMTDGRQMRDFIYIDDLTDALLKVMNANYLPGHIINLAYGESVMLKELAIRIATKLNRKENLVFGGIPNRSFEIMDYKIEISKAKELLNWHPQTSLSLGIEKTISYYSKEILSSEV